MEAVGITKGSSCGEWWLMELGFMVGASDRHTNRPNGCDRILFQFGQAVFGAVATTTPVKRLV